MMQTDSPSSIVGVYGSLKRGFYNHGFLSRATYLGESWLSGFRMHSLGFYPGVILFHDREERVLVEWYQVQADTLVELDGLEGFQRKNPVASTYLRESIESPFGTAWIYLYNQSIEETPHVPSGNWREEDNR